MRHARLLTDSVPFLFPGLRQGPWWAASLSPGLAPGALGATSLSPGLRQGIWGAMSLSPGLRPRCSTHLLLGFGRLVRFDGLMDGSEVAKRVMDGL